MSNVIDFREYKEQRRRLEKPNAPAAKLGNRGHGGYAAAMGRDDAAMVGSRFKSVGRLADEIVRQLPR